MIHKPLPPPGQLIGARKPHDGGAKIRQLRAEHAQYSEEQLLAWTDKWLSNNPTVQLDFAIPAIRAWNYDYRAGYLCSLAFSYKWTGPVEREKVNPSRRGSSGFWAVKPSGIDILWEYSPAVIGIVELSERVIEHDRGWRAAVCTIVELYCVGDLTRAARARLESAYQCDVLDWQGVDHLFRRLKGEHR